MSIKTILTTIALVAGSSTAALAAPRGHGPVVRTTVAARHEMIRPMVRANARPFERDRDRDNRWSREREHERERERVRYERPRYYEPSYYRSTYVQPTYVEPAYVQPIVSVQPQLAQSSQYIALGSMTGNGIQLSLAAGEDSAFIDRVVINYADGHTAEQHLDRQLDGYNAVVDLQTEACPIAGVTVVGQGAISASLF